MANGAAPPSLFAVADALKSSMRSPRVPASLGPWKYQCAAVRTDLHGGVVMLPDLRDLPSFRIVSRPLVPSMCPRVLRATCGQRKAPAAVTVARGGQGWGRAT